MTQKKGRKPLDTGSDIAGAFSEDEAIAKFVKQQQAQPKPEPENAAPMEPSEMRLPEPKPTKSTTPAKGSVMERLLEVTDKEATIRLTVDMPESLHRKLSILCARTGNKKAVVVRTLLEDALKDFNE